MDQPRPFTPLSALFAALLLLACDSAQNQIAQNSAAAHAASAAAKPDGAAIFRKYCVLCHGADGKLGLNGAKDLTKSTLSLEQQIQQITHGKNMMTPFEEVLTPEEIRAVAEYTFALKK